MTEHAHPNYLKIYFILLILLVASIIGPEIGEAFDFPALTLVTAFGIAIVKAIMVAGWFMHLNHERKFVWYILLSCMAFLFIFIVAVSPDVMKKSGQHWVSNIVVEGEKAHDDNQTQHPVEVDPHAGHNH